MMQVAIESESVKRCFKTEDNIRAFLEEAASLELPSILEEIRSDLLHQRSLESVRKGEVVLYENGKSLIQSLNG